MSIGIALANIWSNTSIYQRMNLTFFQLGQNPYLTVTCTLGQFILEHN